MKKLITIVLFVLIFAGGIAGALYFRGQTQRLRTENEAMVTAAEERLSAAKAALAAIDPGTVEGAENQLRNEQAIVDQAISEAEALEAENDGLDSSIRRAAAELEGLKAQDDNAYYLTVYEALREGMEKVEGYIEGN